MLPAPSPNSDPFLLHRPSLWLRSKYIYIHVYANKIFSNKTKYIYVYL